MGDQDVIERLDRENAELKQRLAELEGAEAARRASEERYRQIVELAREGVWFIDAQSKTTFVNQRMAELLGYTVAEMLGQPLLSFADDEGRAIVQANLERRRRGIGEQHDFKFCRKDGSALWAIVETSPLIGADGAYNGAMAMVTDITERKVAEAVQARLVEQLQASQKMEAIGSLAGGIAHDFNNLLAVILSYTSLAIAQTSGKVRQELLEVERAGERAAALTRQLLAFGRRQVLEMVPLSLNRVAQDIEPMMRRIIGEDIDLQLSLGPGLGAVSADPGQLEQVLMNLVVNSRDAMPNGGRLTIRTYGVEFDEAQARARGLVEPGRYVCLSVSDTGCGMDETTKARVFEPFFTTKPQGKGTGLGLSMVYGIVTQSGGFITVDSPPGQGTEFRVYLRQLDSAESAAVMPLSVANPEGGGETILVVDDEPTIVELVAHVLAGAGYNVLCANSGQEAQRICESHTADLHLLLTDVVMPDVSGRLVAERLVQLRPSLKVLYMSGYAGETMFHHGLAPDGSGFLGKPFNPTSLLRKVRAVLDSGATLADLSRAERDQTGASEEPRGTNQRWKREIELRNSQKLEAIGSLAAGIAHEINTPAQYISDSLHFIAEACDAQKQLAASHRAVESALSADGGHAALVEAMREVERRVDLDFLEDNVPASIALCQDGLAHISSIVQALKSIAQPGVQGKAAADLNAALEAVLTLSRNEYKYVAEIERDLGKLPLVSCHIGDVSQALLSLIVNAAHAVAEAATKREEKGRIRVVSRREGDWARIDIADNGMGIADSIRERVFDPFFTTKPLGKGMGQGLAMARAVIEEAHGGSLTFESSMGLGTTFTLRLPLPPEDVAASPEEPVLPTEAAVVQPRARILVIDDEPPIGVAMGRVLRRDFEVVVTTGAAQALDILAQDQGFDVLLCDLYMPELNGMDLHARLLETWPELAARIVFMTGGASTERTRDFLAQVNRPWLLKPVEPKALFTAIRAQLATKGSS